MIYLSMMTLAVVSFQVGSAIRFTLQSKLSIRPSGSSGAIPWHSVRRAARSLATSVSARNLQVNSYTHRNAEYFALKGVLEEPSIGSAKIPAIVFCVYQLMFAAIT